jgi:PAS domain-containing protein
VNAFQTSVTWLLAVAVVLSGAVALGWMVGRRSVPKPAPKSSEAESTTPAPNERQLLRASALDSLADAVLVVDVEGVIRDCNSSALTLFDRHRDAVEEQFATTLRRFDGQDQTEPCRFASEHFVWAGEGWARQPDGGMKMCHVRVMAIRDARARVLAFAESYRPVIHDQNVEQEVRDLLYGVRMFEPAGTRSEQISAMGEELRVLSEGFRDLDHVVRQYERLLPSLSADDPLTEAIAGAAHDARAAVTAVGVAALLEEIPLALARLRAHVQSLGAEPAETDPTATSAQDSRTGIDKHSA